MFWGEYPILTKTTEIPILSEEDVQNMEKKVDKRDVSMDQNCYVLG